MTNKPIYIKTGLLIACITPIHSFLIKLDEGIKTALSERSVLHNITLRLMGEEATREEFESALQTVVENGGMKESIAQWAYNLEIQLFDQQEEVVDYIPHSKITAITQAVDDEDPTDTVIYIITQKGDFITTGFRTDAQGIHGEFIKYEQ